MAEKNLDFDTVIDRTHTNSLKYDFAVQRGKPKDVLPLWVADMDFQVSSYIQEALSGNVAHGIFGYSEVEGSYFEAVAGWMSRHYGWNVEETWLVKTPGLFLRWHRRCGRSPSRVTRCCCSSRSTIRFRR